MFTLILTSAVLGQCYTPGSSYGVSRGYGGAIYGKPIYAPTYQPQTYNYNANATAYFTADPAYFAASVAAYTKKQIQDAAALQAQTDLAAKLAKLDETVGKLTLQFGQALAPDPRPQPQQPYAAPLPPLASPQTPTYATPQVPDKASPSVPGKSSYGDGGSSYSLSAPPPFGIGPPPGASDALAAEAMQRSRCTKCHTGSGASGGFTIFDAPGRLAQLTDADRTAIVRAVDERRMPPRKEGVRVSPADQAAIYGLLGAGPTIAGSPRSGY